LIKIKNILRVPGPIVTSKWLNTHIEHRTLLIFDGTIKKATDVSTSKKRTTFIKNSLFFDIKNEFSDVDALFPNTMISAELFQERARRLGVNSDSCIVVYDQYGYYSCARVWWMFKTMGFDNITVLDGGLPHWMALNLPVQDVPNELEVWGDFKAVYIKNRIHDHRPVLDAINNKNKIIIDARVYNRFVGIEPEPRKGLRSGHIPNSRSIPYLSLLKNGKMKSKEELIQIFKEFIDKELIFSCGSGLTACVLALGAEIADIKNKSVYDGSWTEWGRLKELPIEKGVSN
jgi:thiosulfate/3-mercaptopyruvate sulfurtransferase